MRSIGIILYIHLSFDVVWAHQQSKPSPKLLKALKSSKTNWSWSLWKPIKPNSGITHHHQKPNTPWKSKALQQPPHQQKSLNGSKRFHWSERSSLWYGAIHSKKNHYWRLSRMLSYQTSASSIASSIFSEWINSWKIKKKNWKRDNAGKSVAKFSQKKNGIKYNWKRINEKRRARHGDAGKIDTDWR